MKTSMLVLVLMASSSYSWAQSHLAVVIKNVKEGKGTVRVGIFKDEGTFLKDAWVGKVVKAEQGDITVTFENIPPGKYAVSIIHDENENGELDSNLIGLPKEGFGFSNDAMGTFGPPSFEKASFVVSAESRNLGIAMRYL